MFGGLATTEVYRARDFVEYFIRIKTTLSRNYYHQV